MLSPLLVDFSGSEHDGIDNGTSAGGICLAFGRRRVAVETGSFYNGAVAESVVDELTYLFASLDMNG